MDISPSYLHLSLQCWAEDPAASVCSITVVVRMVTIFYMRLNALWAICIGQLYSGVIKKILA